MDRKIECDVLVVGAGVAGMRAAVAAQQKGARVVLIVKGRIGTCGASAYTVTEASGFGVADGYRCPEDNPEIHFQDIMRAGHGMCDEAVVRRLVNGALETISELEQFGVEFEKEEGRYLISQGCFGSIARNYNLRGHGTKIIRALQKQLKEPTVILEETMAADLLVSHGRCVGAAAIDRIGNVTQISAGAVIMASGGAGGLFKFALNPAQLTGDSYALGYLAGAKIQNMEFMQIGMGVLHPARSILNSWIWSLYPKVTDRNGASVFPEVFPDGITKKEAMDAKSVHYPFSRESVSRNIEIAMQRAITEGRCCEHGGLKLDVREALRNKKGEKLQLFEDMWRLTNGWFLSRGIDVEHEPIEVGCFAHAINGGIKIDSDSRTTVPGLFAVGEASTGPHGADRLGGNMMMTCVVYGKIAGETAAAEALCHSHTELAKYRPLPAEGNGIHASQLMEQIRCHMTDDLLVIRSEEKCRHLKEQLQLISEQALDASYENMDAWAPYHLRNMLITAQMMADAVQYRRESRGSHFREDYPKENPQYNAPYTIQKV